jgi:hypothetical protein
VTLCLDLVQDTENFPDLERVQEKLDGFQVRVPPLVLRPRQRQRLAFKQCGSSLSLSALLLLLAPLRT